MTTEILAIERPLRRPTLSVVSPRAGAPVGLAVQPLQQPKSSPAPATWSPRSGAVATATASKTSVYQTLATLAVTGGVFALGAVVGPHVAALGGWTYPIVAVSEFMDSATPLVPSPGHALVYFAAAHSNSLFVASLATLGSTLGETVGYITGCRGQQAIQASGLLRACAARFSRWQNKVIIGLAAIPIPLYLSGIWAGAFGISYGRFVLNNALGKLVLFGTLVVLGHYRG